MTRNTVIKIDLILHATEDFQKIADTLNDLFGIENDEITKHEVPGHFGNPILMLHMDLKKKRADQFIKKLISLITRDVIMTLLTKVANDSDTSPGRQLIINLAIRISAHL